MNDFNALMDLKAQVIKAQQITITKVVAKGSNRIAYNVELNDVPFGQIWTFKAKGEFHPFHVKTLRGEYTTRANYEAAERAIRAFM